MINRQKVKTSNGHVYMYKGHMNVYMCTHIHTDIYPRTAAMNPILLSYTVLGIYFKPEWMSVAPRGTVVLMC